MKHKKFIIGAIILCAAIGVLAFFALGDSIDYYNTISELKAQEVSDETVKVRGVVMQDSIEFDSGTGEYSFILYDEEDEAQTLPVVYTGALPDSFKEEGGVVAEGKLTSSQEPFQASRLIVSCPSKYESEE